MTATRRGIEVAEARVAGARARERDFTVKLPGHFTFHFTVKFTVKCEKCEMSFFLCILRGVGV